MELRERVRVVGVLLHGAVDGAGDAVVHLAVELVKHLRQGLAQALAQLHGAVAQSLGYFAAHSPIPPNVRYPSAAPARPGADSSCPGYVKVSAETFELKVS